MAYLDYNDVRNGSYAKLKTPAKVLIPVIITLADDHTAKISLDDAHLDKLQFFSGLGKNQVRSGLQDLNNQKYISMDSKRGRPAKITYLPLLSFIQQKQSQEQGAQIPMEKDADERRPDSGLLCEKEGPNQAFFYSQEHTAHPQHDYPKSERQIPCSLNTPDLNTKTTTEIPPAFINEMIKEHGKTVVVSTLSAMEKIEKASPGKIRNPGAYLRDCCTNGWTPTDKITQEKEQIKARYAKQREDQDKADLEAHAHKERVRAERNDPTVQARRAKQMDLFYLKLESTPRTDPKVASGHARPKNEF